jgi:HlyD family secretion protein
MKRFLKVLVLLLALTGVVAGAVFWYMRRNEVPTASFRLAQVKRGDLAAEISATGTVEPEEVVDVGAQVAGQIKTFGTDKNGRPIDYGSAVEAGTVLAHIDDSLYAADVAQTAAALAQAQANLQQAQANLGQLQAKLNEAARDWDRAQKLGPGDALAQTSYDAYQAGYETAKANLAVGEATVVQTKAAVMQADAALKRAQQNLGYCTIISPVRGVIIDRRVNIGQTVVSSLNAPSLFLIAKDLRRMEVWVSVNEADIGSISPGQLVTFTVDARPGQTFSGKVAKVRLNATMTQNVVTYTVVVATDNSSGRLLPYLTANVQFEVARHTNVFIVPNVALRWTPRPEEIAPEFRQAALPSGTGGAEKSGRPAQPAAERGRGRTGVLWTRDGDYVRPVRVRTGLNDGTMTEVEGKDLKEGLEVVVGEEVPEATGVGTSTNPFTPQFRRTKESSQGQR